MRLPTLDARQRGESASGPLAGAANADVMGLGFQGRATKGLRRMGHAGALDALAEAGAETA